MHRSSLSFAAGLAMLAGHALAQPQIQPVPGLRRPELQIGRPQPVVTDYSVWAAGGDRTSVKAARVRQGFVARMNSLGRIEVNATGGGTLTAVVTGEGVTESAPVTISGETGTATFDPDLNLTPGAFYTVEFRSSGEHTFYLAKNDESYVFSEAQRRVGSEWDNRNQDLNMKVTGTGRLTVAQPAPTRRALLIMMENGGFLLDGVQEFSDSMPRLTFYTCGSCSFELKQNESFDQFLSRVAGSLGNCVQCIDPGKWRKETKPLAGWLEGFTDYALEELAKSIDLATRGTSSCKYDRVVTCEDGDFTTDGVLAALDELADDYIVDIHILSHGGIDSIVGYNNHRLTPHGFFRQIEMRQASGEMPLNIGGVYQQNCFSGSLVAEWLAVGAKAVNGTDPAKLNFMPTQYFGFLKHWMNGERFDQSVQKGYDEARPFFDVLYIQTPQNVQDSRMFVHGLKSLRFE